MAGEMARRVKLYKYENWSLDHSAQPKSQSSRGRGRIPRANGLARLGESVSYRFSGKSCSVAEVEKVIKEDLQHQPVTSI